MIKKYLPGIIFWNEPEDPDSMGCDGPEGVDDDDSESEE